MIAQLFTREFWTHPEHIWVLIGFMGQALFFGRFFVQWLASEKARRSVVPNAFWYFSILGGGTLLSYAIWKRDPVFITGQAAGLLIYFRNLHFLRRARLEEKQA
jgi:lipid-A-disaccharide synthase-like uncharacterized protein